MRDAETGREHFVRLVTSIFFSKFVFIFRFYFFRKIYAVRRTTSLTVDRTRPRETVYRDRVVNVRVEDLFVLVLFPNRSWFHKIILIYFVRRTRRVRTPSCPTNGFRRIEKYPFSPGNTSCNSDLPVVERTVGPTFRTDSHR